MELIMPAIDHLSDPLKTHFIALSHEYEIPEFVKQASEVQLEAPALTIKNAYALPSRKALPIHTKAAAWLSAIYFDSNLDLTAYERKVASTNLRRALDVYGLSWPHKKEDAQEPEPADADYLVHFEKNGKMHRRLPCRNTEEAKMAMAYLREHRLELPVDIRKQASESLLWRINKYGMEIPSDTRDTLQKDACQFLVHSDDLSRFLVKRAKMAVVGGYQEVGQSLAKAASEIKALDTLLSDEATLLETLSVVEELESKLQIPKYAAVDDMDAIPATKADDYFNSMIVLKSGHVYQSVDKVAAHANLLPGVDINEVKPDGLTVDRVKLASVLEKMDESQAEAIAAVLKKAGVEANVYLPPDNKVTDDDWKILAGS